MHSMNQNELRSHFDDAGRAGELLKNVTEPLIGSFDERGEPYEPDHLHRIVLDAVRKSPVPDKALLNLHRMSEASFGVSFARDLIRYPVLMDLAVTVGSYSQFLSDIIVKDPELFRWITTSGVLSITKSRDDYAGELEKQTGLFTKLTVQFNSVRRFYRREILRIGVRDLLAQAPFDIIVGEISDLADAISGMILRMIVEDTAAKYGAQPSVPFTVVGLGKLGGRELNYSSDIDIMFVLEEDESFKTGSGLIKYAVDFFSTVADRWIAVMTGHSPEGSLYRVDARLRPDGKAGPLVRTAQGYRTYYETRGELWERQMLIKARPIAGDVEFGRSFIDSLQSFIYPATLFQSPRETIARMKARIEKRSQDPDNIKLCRGGIRDIEFIVQTLQLLNGGKDKQIRSTATLPAIELLNAKKYLNDKECSTLKESYIFFRKLEHLVQLDENIRTHSIPAAERDRIYFARKAGFGSAEEFNAVLQEKLLAVSNIFDDVFQGDPNGTPVEFLFDERGGWGETDASGLGFTDERRARELLSQLAHGVTSLGIGEHDTQTKEVFRSIAPGLLHDFSITLNPDRALVNFLSIVQEYPHPHSLYIALRNESIRKALINVCGFSNSLSLRLAKYPEDLELFFSNGYELLETENLLKAGIERTSGRYLDFATHARFINGKCNLPEVHRVLSFIAVRRIRQVLHGIYRDYELDDPGIAVLSLGKLSGEEIGPGADLDLVFLYEPEGGLDAGMADKIVKEFIRRCTVVDETQIPYEVDMRLRPEGKSGPLAVELSIYREYLEKRASLWERQSLVRARVIESPGELASQINRMIEEYVYEKPLEDGWVDEIREMRFRTESRSQMNRQDFINTKTGPGGIMDIEFIVQTIQLHAGKKRKSIRLASTRDALAVLKKLGWYETGVIDDLSAAYDLYRQVEYFNRIYSDDPSNLVPRAEAEGSLLMKMLKINENPHVYIRNSAGRIRKLFLTMMEEGKIVSKQ